MLGKAADYVLYGDPLVGPGAERLGTPVESGTSWWSLAPPQGFFGAVDLGPEKGHRGVRSSPHRGRPIIAPTTTPTDLLVLGVFIDHDRSGGESPRYYPNTTSTSPVVRATIQPTTRRLPFQGPELASHLSKFLSILLLRSDSQALLNLRSSK